MEHPLYQARLQVKADMLDPIVTITCHFRNILPSQSLSIVLKKVNITQQIRYAPMKKKPGSVTLYCIRPQRQTVEHWLS